MNNALLYKPVTELGMLLRTRQVSPVELTTEYIKRAQMLDPWIFAVVTLNPGLAMSQARAAEAEIMKGRIRSSLHGIPWGAKDLFATEGTPTQWGCPAYQGQLLNYDATVVRKLRNAGAVLIGKLAPGELASGARWFGGVARCPWDPARTSGGSSGGPGAATAAGFVGFATEPKPWVPSFHRPLQTESWGCVRPMAGSAGTG